MSTQVNIIVTAPQLLPHEYDAIVKDAKDSLIKSAKHLFGHRYNGILLNNNKRYWIDKKSKNCFLVYARGLKIAHHDNMRYWQWPSLEETSDVFIDAAELLAVCWLDVQGKFDTTKLSPETLYEVVFVVMLKATGNGWEIPVNVRLTLPDGNKQERTVNLMEKARGQWIEIPVGEFKTSTREHGEIVFLMDEHGGHWKNGLVIKGVAVQPKKRRER